MTTTFQTRSFNVHIPNLYGDGIAETIPVQVQVRLDSHSGEELLTPESLELIEKTKARHMGLLTPDQIKTLRERLGLTQKQISELLQIGEKTWTRWESGRERPFRSINVLLSALRDGKLDVTYLHSLARTRTERAARLAAASSLLTSPWQSMVQQAWQDWQPEAGRELFEALHRTLAEFVRSTSQQPDFGWAFATRLNYFATQPRTMINVQPSRPTAPLAPPPITVLPSPRDLDLDTLAA